MLTFFNENFGRHLVPQTGDPLADAARALSASHATKTNSFSRLSSGWAIVRPGQSTVQFELAAPGFQYSKLTRFEAFLAELEAWDGTPRIFMEFDKRPLPILNVFRTFDLRQVRICTPKGVETFDFTQPATETSSRVHKRLWALKKERALTAQTTGLA